MQPTIFTSIAGLASKRGIASTLSIALRTTLLRNAHTPRDERAYETSLGGDGSSRLGGGGAMPQPLGGGRLRLAGGRRRHVLPQAAGSRCSLLRRRLPSPRALFVQPDLRVDSGLVWFHTRKSRESPVEVAKLAVYYTMSSSFYYLLHKYRVSFGRGEVLCS